MRLEVVIGDQIRIVTVEKALAESAKPLLDKMDKDMNNGWRLGRDFLVNPSTIQRCQIAADRLLTGLHSENEAIVTLMAAYILLRLPTTKSVDVNLEGEMQETLFYDHDNSLIQ